MGMRLQVLHPVRPGLKQVEEVAHQEPRHPATVFPALQQEQNVMQVQVMNSRLFRDLGWICQGELQLSVT